jgi:hypothetical protein
MRSLMFAALVSCVLLSSCATSRFTTIEDIPRAPALPHNEQVAAIGLRAKQLWVSLSPKVAKYATDLGADQFTSIWMEIVYDFPPEAVVAQPHAYQLTAYALAHQWGCTQIAIDYLRRLEKYVDDQIREVDAKRAAIAWSSFFAAMTSIGSGPSSADSQTYVDRLVNELSITRNTQSVQLNNLFSEHYSEQANDIATIKRRATELKQQLTARAKLLDVYRGWLFEASKKLEKEMPADAKKILDAKISL